MQPFLKSFQLNLSQVLCHLSQSKPVKLIANILTHFSTVLSFCRDQPINLDYKPMRYGFYIMNFYHRALKTLEGRGGSKIHNNDMTNNVKKLSQCFIQITLKINVLTALLFLCLFLV